MAEEIGMASFHFMPWLRLQKPYTVGEIALIPWHRRNPPQEFTADEIEKVDSVLSSYKSPNGEPVRHFTVVRFATRKLLADVDQDQRGYLRDSFPWRAYQGLPPVSI